MTVLPFEDTSKPNGPKAGKETMVLVPCRGPCGQMYQKSWIDAANDVRMGRTRWGHWECLVEDAQAGDEEAQIVLANHPYNKEEAPDVI